MFLFEYIIKLLMGNSNTIFIGLIIVVFGYYGWLLWQISEQVNIIADDRSDNKEMLNHITQKVEKLEDIIYQDVMGEVKDNMSYLQKIYSQNKDLNTGTDRIETNIISEIRDESDDLKEFIKILMGRSIPDDEEEIANDEFDEQTGNDYEQYI